MSEKWCIRTKSIRIPQPGNPYFWYNCIPLVEKFRCSCCGDTFLFEHVRIGDKMSHREKYCDSCYYEQLWRG